MSSIDPEIAPSDLFHALISELARLHWSPVSANERDRYFDEPGGRASLRIVRDRATAFLVGRAPTGETTWLITFSSDLPIALQINLLHAASGAPTVD